MKVLITIVVDPDVITQARIRGLNISAACEAGLMSALTSGEMPVLEAANILDKLPSTDRVTIEQCVKRGNDKALRYWSRHIWKLTGKTVTVGMIKKIIVPKEETTS